MYIYWNLHIRKYLYKVTKTKRALYMCIYIYVQKYVVHSFYMYVVCQILHGLYICTEDTYLYADIDIHIYIHMYSDIYIYLYIFIHTYICVYT